MSGSVAKTSVIWGCFLGSFPNSGSFGPSHGIDTWSRTSPLGSLHPDFRLDPLGSESSRMEAGRALVFPCGQGRTLVQMRSLGRCKAEMERLMTCWAQRGFVVTQTISVPGLKHFELCFVIVN